MTSTPTPAPDSNVTKKDWFTAVSGFVSGALLSALTILGTQCSQRASDEKEEKVATRKMVAETAGAFQHYIGTLTRVLNASPGYPEVRATDVTTVVTAGAYVDSVYRLNYARLPEVPADTFSTVTLMAKASVTLGTIYVSKAAEKGISEKDRRARIDSARVQVSELRRAVSRMAAWRFE